MKKWIAILAALVLTAALACAAAEETVFTFHGGITFGMSMDEVIAAEKNPVHETDIEHTHGPVTFAEVEYEHIQEEGVRADLKYLFVDNKLAAIRMGHETRDTSWDQVIAFLTGKYGAEVPFDAARLGNGVYALDDDGIPEAKITSILYGDVMITVEMDDDGEDIDVTFVDLTAPYITQP